MLAVSLAAYIGAAPEVVFGELLTGQLTRDAAPIASRPLTASNTSGADAIAAT
jgi:hypothetical protein